MLHNQALTSDPLQDEIRAVIDAFSCNVQDRHWLIYCAMGGHEHYDLADIDPNSSLSLPEFYVQAA